MMGWILAAFFLTTLQAQAQFSLNRVYVPQSFAADDTVHLIGEYHLPDTCYKPLEPHVEIDSERREIVITPVIHQLPGQCLQFDFFYPQTISFGNLPSGVYSIRDSGSPTPLGEIVITKPRLQRLTAPRHPSVSQAYLYWDRGETWLRLSGTVWDSCFEITSVETVVRENMILIYPKTTRTQESSCESNPTSFTRPFDVGAIAPGHYFLYVHTPDGHSIQQLVDIP